MVISKQAVSRKTAAVVLRVGVGQERTKSGIGVATNKGGRTGVCAE